MKLKHYEGDGRARFITFSTNKRLPILTNAVFRMAVIEAISRVRLFIGFKLLGFVLMPDLVHLILVPSAEIGIGRIIGEIKRESAITIINAMRNCDSSLLNKLQIMRNGKPKLAIWVRRCFDHNCRTPEAVWEKIRYCHNNPVKQGLVRNPAAWEWSSYRWYQGLPGSLLEIESAG